MDSEDDFRSEGGSQMGRFKKVFRRLDDPRVDNASHDLCEILFIALAAVLCGADALHCHRAFATTVPERGADYVLALKQNQSKLHAAVTRCFARAVYRWRRQRYAARAVRVRFTTS